MLSNEDKQGVHQKATVDGSRQDSSNASSNPLPSISLPKGGGALRGLGEKFAANPVTGTGSLTLPIATSPGRSGVGPQLSLSYDSGTGNGPFGFGWSLALPSITRKTDKGLPQYVDGEEFDTFILSGAEDLVPSLIQNNGQWTRDVSTRTVYNNQYTLHTYRPRIEGLFARIERWANISDPQDTFWRSISKENITTWYGKTAESRIADPTDPARIFSWLICESYDDRGNVCIYQYKAEDSAGVDLSQANERNRSDVTRSANRYLKHVFYGNQAPYFPNLAASSLVLLPAKWYFELVFDYGEHDENEPQPQETQPWNCRADPFSACRATFEVRTYRLCQRALMFHHFASEAGVGLNCLVRSTDFTHAQPPPSDPTRPFYAFLLSATQTGYVRNTDGSYLSSALPPLEFTYSEAVIDETVQDIDPESLANLPYGLDGTNYRWVDLDGEGLSGVLTEQAGSWFYKPNLSPVNVQTIDGTQSTLAQFGAVELVTRQPSLTALGSGRQELLGLTGDGRLDLVAFDSPTPGYFERTSDEDWRPFRQFHSLPVLDWQNPNLRFVDLTGDGLADILISEDNAFSWHPSLGPMGFGPAHWVQQALDEERGPKLLFADSTESIFLADLSGDGLIDLVRIRNGEVCYWPNLGYCNFGAKVTMDQAPWFEASDVFEGRRILLADIDGSGTTDIVYFASRGVQIYFNQSGNAWSAARPLNTFPPVESVSSATALDLLGNGTACLLWSSPLASNRPAPMRYIDLMGGQKPHLLIQTVTNLGAETRVQYAPSTRFYVADKLAETPWVTRVPFPVHVVERVETYDYISRNRFVTRYAYHHGYYDGYEREFRGFGMVEQWDTEELAVLTAGGNLPPTTNEDDTSSVPPVLTRTWFHTGVFFGRNRISRHFEDEYYYEPVLSEAQLEAMLLDDSLLPTTVYLPDETRLPYDLCGDEAREACRSLKGSLLRQEIYALDGTDAEQRPYSVSEHNYTIELLQPQGSNLYAVFSTHAREAIDFHYERTLFPIHRQQAADPRVSHTMTLTADIFGNVLQSVGIAYGRRYDDPDARLSDDDRQKQKKILLACTQSQYTNAIQLNDAYRVPLLCDASTYELINVIPNANQSQVTNLFRFDELAGKIQAASDGQHDLPYEDIDASGALTGDPYRRPLAHSRSLSRSNNLSKALALGVVESMALPFESYTLAFTPGLLTRVYQRQNGTVTEALLPDPVSVLGTEGGYVPSNDLKASGSFPASDPDDCWWVPSGQLFYSPGVNDPPAQELSYAQQHFFLLSRHRDPFGNTTTITYDGYDLLVQEAQDSLENRITVGTRDPHGNLMSKSNDYRVLQPALIMDANRNRSAVAFDILGMVVGTAVMGKPEETLGDSLASFVPDLTDTVIAAHLHDPLTNPQEILQQATTRLVYDLFAYQRTQNDPQPQPAVVYTLARETHVSDLALNQQTTFQHGFSYSDGFGREIQKKAQAEPGPLVEGGPESDPRWVGSGWTVYNNKGKPVRQYEPFFSATHHSEFAMVMGVSSVLFYDPVERVVATLHPNHTYEKVAFDPWKQASWDVNDTVLLEPRTDPDVGPLFQLLPDADYLPTWYGQRQNGSLGAQEQNTADKAAAHAGTPSLAYADSQGRTFLTLADNAAAGTYTTRVELDIEGHQRAVIDAKARVVMRYDYNMLGTQLHQASMEAGERWMLNDVTGKPIYAWDSRNHRFRTAYDALRRPTDSFLRAGTGPELLIGHLVYGETQPDPEAKNLRGKVVQLFDQAGLVRTDEYDFKGNSLASQRQLAQEYKTTLDWSANPELEQETFAGSTTYDALNRPISVTTPDTSIYRPTFNEANLLERVDVNLRGAQSATSFVANIDYDAKGQRILIEYGSNVKTEYTYDRLTSRLTNLKTTRSTDQAQLQDLSYTYDPVGNITHIQDYAQQTIYFRNRQVEPSTDYTYDAMYRLLSASGREHLGQASTGGSGLAPITLTYDDSPRMGILQPGDGNAIGGYLQQYTYDEVGNILHMLHGGIDPANPGWTRVYSYNEPSLLEGGKFSNCLSSTTVSGGSPEVYAYDPHGNMTSMPHLTLMQWDYKNQLQATAQQVVNDGTPETTYYVYDMGEQRVRKVTERQNGTRKNERIYLGGFEVYREHAGDGTSVSLERETLHVMDDIQRIALVETKTIDNQSAIPPPQPLIRYQFGNHLGSASLELDDTGQIISYEEYYPYGSTSYQAGRNAAEVSLKRYRYTGMERDEETEFTYHGARYYVPWLGRWVSCDPTSINAGLNLFLYVNGSPILLVDTTGKEPRCFPVNDQYAPKIGPLICLPDPGHTKRSTKGPGRKRSGSSSTGSEGKEGGLEGGTATKSPTGTITEAGAGDGQGGLGEPTDVGTGTNVGTGTLGTNARSPIEAGTGKGQTTGGKPEGKPEGKPSGKESGSNDGSPDSGEGKGNDSSLLGDLAALASLISDPESLYNAKQSGNTGKGAQIGSKSGIIRGWIAQVLVIVLVFGDKVAKVFKAIANSFKKGLGSLLDKLLGTVERKAIEETTSKILISEQQDLVLAVIKDGKVISQTPINSGLSHEEFLIREFGTKELVGPLEGAEVVSVGKWDGEIVPIRSWNIHGNRLPASQAAFDAVRKVFK